MKINNNLSIRLYNLLESSKKVSRMNIVKEDFVKYMNTINAINALNEDDYTYQGILLDKWDIPDILADFIYPSKVSLTGARNEVDLLVRNADDDSNPVLNLTAFLDMTSFINGALKRDLNQIRDIQSLRVSGDIAGRGNRQVMNGLVKDCGSLFFPLEFNCQFIKTQWLNYSAEDMVYELLRNKIIDKK